MAPAAKKPAALTPAKTAKTPPASHNDESLERGSREHYDDAGYYDFTYRRRGDDVAFYKRWVRQYGGPVLELGGGSGRVAIPLVREGAKVTVLDASAAMLERARERAERELTSEERKRLTLVHGDVREFSLGKKFPTITAPFNVLLHLYEPEDFARCFQSVRAHLSAQGRFVFDVRVPSLTELARNPERVYKGRPFKHPTLGHRVEYTEQFRYDPIKQVQHVTIRFAPAKGSPRGTKPFETLLTQRQLFPNELRGLLQLGGLTLAGRWGDFSQRPLGEEDALEIVAARRK